MTSCTPAEVAEAARLAVSDPARPEPLVVRGSRSEWVHTAAKAKPSLLSCPVATIAQVVGERPPQAGTLDCFDLVASGSEETAEAALAGWLDAFAATPQACTVLARLVREPGHSLHRESLAYSMLQAGPEHDAWLASLHASPAGDPGPRVTVAEAGRIREVVLSRPARRNALDALMREELCDTLDALASDPEVVVVLARGSPSPAGATWGSSAPWLILSTPTCCGRRARSPHDFSC
jgi:hypothetical protein